MFLGKDMVQNFEIVPNVEKLDGYNVETIKGLRGSRCKFCKKPRGVTACYVPICKGYLKSVHQSTPSLSGK